MSRLQASLSRVALLLFPSVFFLSGCNTESETRDPAKVELTLAGYSVPREAFAQAVLPAYVKKRAAEGVKVTFNESYLASGAQSRAVVSGFGADVVALSLEPDVQRLVDARLVSPGWNAKGAGMITRSVAVIAFRDGNPRGIKGWEDLARPGIDVLTANPKTSGGAMWNILAAVGAVKRGHVTGYEASDAGAVKFLTALLKNVRIMDRSGRESMMTFERGTGDAIITYENEVLIARKHGKKYGYIVPSSTVLIENPAALVDAVVDKHQAREEAERFLAFLLEEGSQRAFAEHGFRPVSESVQKEKSALFAPVKDQFSVRDLGGWSAVRKDIFGPSGLFEESLRLAQAAP